MCQQRQQGPEHHRVRGVWRRQDSVRQVYHEVLCQRRRLGLGNTDREKDPGIQPHHGGTSIFWISVGNINYRSNLYSECL